MRIKIAIDMHRVAFDKVVKIATGKKKPVAGRI